MAGVEPNDIYIINKGSEISCVGKSPPTCWRIFLEKYSPEELSHHELSIEESSVARSDRSLNSSQRLSSPSTEGKISSSIKQIPKDIVNHSRESFQRLKSKIRGQTSSVGDDPDVTIDQRSMDSSVSVVQQIPTNEPPRHPMIRVISETFSRSVSDSSTTSLTDRLPRQIVSSSTRRLAMLSSRESFSSYDDPNLSVSLRGKLFE